MRKMLAPLALSFVALIAGARLEAGAETISVIEATLGDKGKTPEVSTQDLRSALVSKSALVLDTRTHAEFEAGHIPGAINIEPLSPGKVLEIAGGDVQREIILYCNGPFCQASRRAADALSSAGFKNVRRYQLGIPVWRALGGPVALGESGVRRVHGKDATAVFIDVRASSDFRKGALDGAVNAPAEGVIKGAVKLQLPEDDFNRRVILLGESAEQARSVADVLGSKPWHNVSYFEGDTKDLLATKAH